MYSALYHPVLEAEFGLKYNNRLGLYDSVALEVRKKGKFASPYDVVDNEKILNWREAAGENMYLKLTNAELNHC